MARLARLSGNQTRGLCWLVISVLVAIDHTTVGAAVMLAILQISEG